MLANAAAQLVKIVQLCKSTDDKPLWVCLQVFLTPGSVGLVMEYAPGGDLFDYIQQHGKLREDQARWIFQQVA